MKNLKLKVVLLSVLFATSISAQKTLNKISKSINVNKDVTIDLNTSYVQLEVDTWNKNVLEIEAYIEGEKLNEAELQKALENWDITVEGSGSLVKIYSKGNRGSWSDDFSNGYSGALKELELELANLPKLLEIALLPNMPYFPAMPEFPELPELPVGLNSINFDYGAYKKDGEKYLEKWSKDYETKYGKEYKEAMKEWARKFGDSDYQKKMEKWGEEFGKKFEGEWSKDLEKWAEEFGEQFGEDWENKMEAWGKKMEESWGKDFEQKMEKWSESFGKKMEERSEELEKRMEERKKRTEERRGRLEERKEKRVKEMEERHNQLRSTRFNIENNNKVKRTIKIKMPKNAKLNMNVRHGELKFSSVIHNLKANLSHSNLTATSIDGNNTSINASYTSILVDNWKNGGLDLNYVENALLKTVNALRLSSNSSNINIDNLAGNSIINGSFGELTIHNILDTFNNLNIVLENSEALVKLPKTSYNFQYNGNKSNLSHPEKKDTNNDSSFSTGNLSSNKTIVVNAKYSTVVMQ